MGHRLPSSRKSLCKPSVSCGISQLEGATVIGATFKGYNIGVCRYICIILCMVIVVGHGVGHYMDYF